MVCSWGSGRFVVEVLPRRQPTSHLQTKFFFYTHAFEMRFFKMTLYTLAALFVLLFIGYKLGSKPPVPKFKMPSFSTATSLTALEDEINRTEQQTKGIRPDCNAHIEWADTSKKVKTKYCVLYLHGFGASYMEGMPVVGDIAKKYGYNAYYARLSEHGLDLGEENLLRFTADNYYESGEKALHIAKQLGEEVIVIGTSGGGAMSLFLGSRHPEIKAMVLYSPAITLARPESNLVGGPWGVNLARWVSGHDHNDWKFKNDRQAKYWTNHQCFEGIAEFINFQKYAMLPENFAKIKCPVFMGYYYEDEAHQDKVVSVAAMHTMFDQLGTPNSLKQKINFPMTKEHVIASDVTSEDWQSVEKETEKFLEGVF